MVIDDEIGSSTIVATVIDDEIRASTIVAMVIDDEIGSSTIVAMVIDDEIRASTIVATVIDDEIRASTIVGEVKWLDSEQILLKIGYLPLLFMLFLRDLHKNFMDGTVILLIIKINHVIVFCVTPS